MNFGCKHVRAGMVTSKGEIFTLHIGSKLGNVSFLAVPLDDLGFKIFLGALFY